MVLAEPGRLTLLDIKTDAAVPATAAAVSPAYLDQLAVYRALLRQAAPDHAVEAVLLYTAGPLRLALPGPLLDAALARITSA